MNELEAIALKHLANMAYELSQCDHAWQAYHCKHRQEFLKAVSKWKQITERQAAPCQESSF